ncbi:MBL fold metallo-hydrolase [Pontibacter sp. G13]|uniref:MBL fold metallo-hydrolase n=1 Tax=Pontibacter sp. G13 TaxID=3074898 RepID=UPI002889D1C3|nr:MBL fold metallo-hydrolase [Pontibacter sp. G13]WNJ19032.1 MBL fold metallo-hydrolase [Pontibacter sp. G13]
MFHSEVKSVLGEDISILVQPDNHPWTYLCECGDAELLTVKEIQHANAIFVSHTHIDHFANFDAVIRHKVGIQRKPIICGPAGIAEQVQARFRSYTWNLMPQGWMTYEIRELVTDDTIKVYEIESPHWELKPLETRLGNVIFEEADFQVTAILLDHGTPTLAYKFQEFDAVKMELGSSGFRGGKWVRELKEAYEKRQPARMIIIDGKEYPAAELFHLLHTQRGDTLGIIMDHAANEANHQKIIEHFGNCRRVYIESFYQAEDKEFAEKNHHSYSTMSGKVMQAAHVREPIPVHFSRKYGEEEVRNLMEEFEAAFRS